MEKEKAISLPGVGCFGGVVCVAPQKLESEDSHMLESEDVFSQHAKEIRQGGVFGFCSPIWL